MADKKKNIRKKVGSGSKTPALSPIITTTLSQTRKPGPSNIAHSAQDQTPCNEPSSAESVSPETAKSHMSSPDKAVPESNNTMPQQSDLPTVPTSSSSQSDLHASPISPIAQKPAIIKTTSSTPPPPHHSRYSPSPSRALVSRRRSSSLDTPAHGFTENTGRFHSSHLDDGCRDNEEEIRENEEYPLAPAPSLNVSTCASPCHTRAEPDEKLSHSTVRLSLIHSSFYRRI
jgi:hypothetical protein